MGGNYLPMYHTVKGANGHPEYVLDLVAGRKNYEALNKFMNSVDVNFDNFTTYATGKDAKQNMSEYMTSKGATDWTKKNFTVTTEPTVPNKNGVMDYGLVYQIEYTVGEGKEKRKFQDQITIPLSEITASSNVNFDSGALVVGQLYNEAKQFGAGFGYKTAIPAVMPNTDKATMEKFPYIPVELPIEYINGKDGLEDDLVFIGGGDKIYDGDKQNVFNVIEGNNKIQQIINNSYAAHRP